MFYFVYKNVAMWNAFKNVTTCMQESRHVKCFLKFSILFTILCFSVNTFKNLGFFVYKNIVIITY